MIAESQFDIARNMSYASVLAQSDEIMGKESGKVREQEYVYRINAFGYDWDVGGRKYVPVDGGRLGPDGKKIGVFLLHGGAGDHRVMIPMAKVLSAHFGLSVATMTFPGQLFLDSPSRRWPGDTLSDDGTARVPHFVSGRKVLRDEYVVTEHKSDQELRARQGTLFFAQALPGSEFYYRLAAWPMAYEAAFKHVLGTLFPPTGGWSVYLHGHSTGGPLMHMMLQRVENVAGLLGAETSPFGAIFSQMLDYEWPFPFNFMTIRTWRDSARYIGREAGSAGIERFPWLMEEVHSEWNDKLHLPNIKFQDLIQFNAREALAEAATVTAHRLAMSDADKSELINLATGYPHPLDQDIWGPVPPLLYSINSNSMDHTSDRYKGILIPALSDLEPSPRVHLCEIGCGVHSYWKPDEGLPMGNVPAIAKLWSDAIDGGFFAR